MTFDDWLTQARVYLEGGESPRRDAQILLGFVTKRTRTEILAFGETQLTLSQMQTLDVLLQRRVKGEPIAHLIGEREFWSLPLRVSNATLIPRPDTECLVEQALRCLPAGPARILDLGTGTGAIALALACERSDCQILAADVMPAAVTLALENAETLGFTNVSVIQSDWFSALKGQSFDLITSNPPYIDSHDPHLQLGDVRFEPLSALVADNHGFADIDWLIQHAAEHLTPGGWLIIEHGWQQGEAVERRFRQAGFTHVCVGKDYGGNDRFTFGQYLPIS